MVRMVNDLGIISAYAGQDMSGYSGDGGHADSCLMGNPYAIALDASRNLYIADYFNNVVRRVDATTGIITTVAGTGAAGYTGDLGPATSATLRYPYGIDVDAAGYIYIADAGNNVIRMVTPSGYIETIAGNGYGAGTGYGHGGYSGDGGPAVAAELNFPSGIAVDAVGNKYIADATNNVIRKVGINDSITTVSGNGMPGYSGDGGNASAGTLNFPSALAIDGLGNIYIADQGNNAIRAIDTAGKIRTVAGNGTAGYKGDGGPASAAQLSAPKGVAVDAAGLIYIADAGNNAIRVVGAYTGNAVKNVTANPSGMKVFPNPATGQFNIELPSSSGDIVISVLDIFGRVVETSECSGLSAVKTVNIASLPAGSYVVKVSAGLETYREKLVVPAQQ